MKKIIPYGLGLLIVLLGLIVMFGWHSHQPRLIQILPEFVPMQYNTAVGFLLSGLAILTMQRSSKVSGCISIFILLLGALTLFEYITSFPINIDQIFMTHYISTHTSYPGRMAPNTALCFFLVSIIFITNGFFSEKKWANQLMILCVMIVGLLSITAVLGYFFKISLLFSWGNLTGMALHTAIGLVVIALACLPMMVARIKAFKLHEEYFACITVAATGIALFLIFWQILLAHQDSLTKKIIEKEAQLYQVKIISAVSATANSSKQTKVDFKVALNTISLSDFSKNLGLQINDAHKILLQKNIHVNDFFRQQWEVKKQFMLLGQQWTISIWPNEYFIKENQSKLPLIILIFGLLITALLVITIRLWQLSKIKSQLIADHEKNVSLAYDATMIAANIEDSKKAMQACLNLICEKIGWPVGHIYLIVHNDQGTFLESARIWYCRKIEKIASFKEISEKFKFTPGIGLPGRVWESKKPAWIENVYLDNNFPRAKQGKEIGVYGAVGFPIIVNGDVIAVFEFFSHESKPRNDALLHTFEIMSEQISRVFERKFLKQKLEYSAYHDFLTGVANRAQFEEFAKKSLARAIRYKKSAAIFMMDLDYLKKVNDTMGHETGDLLLKEVAKRLLKEIREVDTLARLGGDEFALILDDIESPADVNMTAKKLIETMRKPFLINGQKITISISIGIALFPDAGDTITTLMRNADSALYQVKRNGRDNFCQFEKAGGV